MANEKNLIPNEKRTPKELREITKKGGKASVVARRRKKSMKQLAQMLLAFPARPAGKRLLESAGFDPDDANNGALLVHAMVTAGIEGDVQAAKFVADLVGDGAAHELKKQELALKRQALKSAEKQGVETSSAMQQLVDSLRGAG